MKRMILSLALSGIAAQAYCGYFEFTLSHWKELAAEIKAPSTPAAKPVPLSAKQLKAARGWVKELGTKKAPMAMGKLNHMGTAAVPVLIEGLSNPSAQVRNKVMWVLGWINDPVAVPALSKVAKNQKESSSNKILAFQTISALDKGALFDLAQAMAADPSDSVRNVIAINARGIRRKEMIPILIGLLSDTQSYVAATAVSSLWALTQHPTESHDWVSCVDLTGGIVPGAPTDPSEPERILPGYQLPEVKCLESRKLWAREWSDWWKTAEAGFEFPPLPDGQSA